MIVMKFGGTSVQDAKAIDRAARSSRNGWQQKPVVVVSAMAKVTDQLLAMARAAGAGDRETALELCRALARAPLQHRLRVAGNRAVHAISRRTGGRLRDSGRTAARHRCRRRTHAAHHRQRCRLRRDALQQDRGGGVLGARACSRRWWIRASASSPTAPTCRPLRCSTRPIERLRAEGAAAAGAGACR